MHFYFFVPSEEYDKGWIATQSFEASGMQRNLTKLLQCDESVLQQMNVSQDDVELVRDTLVQYAVRLDLSTPLQKVNTRILLKELKTGGAMRQFSTYSRCKLSPMIASRTHPSYAARVVRVINIAMKIVK